MNSIFDFRDKSLERNHSDFKLGMATMTALMLRSLAFGAALLLTTHASAQAQTGAPEEGLSFGFGIGVAPDAVGSNDYIPVPLPSVELRRGALRLRSNGLGLEATLAERNGFSAGVIARLDAGRNDLFDAEDVVVQQLTRVDSSLEAGGFMELSRPYSAMGGGLLVARISAVRGLSGGHEGTLVEGSVGSLRSLGRYWTTGVFVTATAQDDRYADAYFGVSARDAAATGLRRFEARSGLRDVGLSAFAARQVSRRLSMTYTVAYSRLVSDAGQSPIVTERGSRDQLFGGVSLTWRYGQ